MIEKILRVPFQTRVTLHCPEDGCKNQNVCKFYIKNTSSEYFIFSYFIYIYIYIYIYI